MKNILLLSAALVAALTAPALAQRDGRGDGTRAQQSDQYPNRSGSDDGQQRAPQGQPRYDRGNDGGVTRTEELSQVQQRQQAPQVQSQRNDNRSGYNRGDNDRRPDVNRGGNDNRFDNDRSGYNNRPGYDNRRFSQYYRNWNS